VIVADAGGLLVGYAMLRQDHEPSSVTHSRPIELARIDVLKAWQSRGVGAALMERCLAEAGRRGAGLIWLGVWQANVKAQAFYERWGFGIVGTKTFLLGSDEQTDWVMSRDLAATR
jgi:ribosomal protein S18 acetylase RimI-like enzyme